MVDCEFLRYRRKDAVKMGQNPHEINCHEIDCSGTECSLLPSDDNSTVSSIEDEIQEKYLRELEGQARLDKFYKKLERHFENKAELSQ